MFAYILVFLFLKFLLYWYRKITIQCSFFNELGVQFYERGKNGPVFLHVKMTICLRVYVFSKRLCLECGQDAGIRSYSIF